MFQKPIDLSCNCNQKYSSYSDVLEECGKKKVKGVIVITAGFKEVDEEGAKRRTTSLKDIAKKYNMQALLVQTVLE